MKSVIVRRVLLLGVIPVSLVSVILSLYFTSTRFEDLEVALQERGFAIARQLAPASEYGVFAGNREVLQRLAEAALQESDVRAVVIVDDEGQPLARSGEPISAPEAGTLPPTGAVTLDEHGRALIFSAPIHRAQITLERYIDQPAGPDGAAPEAGVLGAVHVKVSRAALVSRKVHLLVDAFLITLLGLGIGAGLALRLGRDVTRPVQKLTEAVERIGQGDLAARVDARSAGELRVLEEGFNAMAGSLQALREHLERRIEQATRDLAEKKEEAERANAAKSRFLAVASHDLRQPIHALGLFVARLRELAGEARGTEIPAAFDPVIGRIEDSVAAVNDLIEALLDISRLDAGVLTPNVTVFPMQRVLDRVEGDFAALARGRGLRFRVRACAGWVLSDPLLVERILRNLASNAVRYTDRGGVLIGCRRRGDMLRVEVRDSGVGIPEALHGEVFQEYFQVAGAARAGEKGLGLGLAIVERLAKLLGHRILLRSRPGRGSLFAVELPLSPDSGCGELPQSPELPDVTPAALVYVIEDDALVLESMVELLRGWGCRVVAASSPGEAMAAAAAGGRAPDLVICDYHLGAEGNGLEVIAGIRARLGEGIPAVLLSGDTDTGLPARSRESGCHFLQKPVRPAKLRSLLRAIRTEERGAS